MEYDTDMTHSRKDFAGSPPNSRHSLCIFRFTVSLFRYIIRNPIFLLHNLACDMLVVSVEYIAAVATAMSNALPFVDFYHVRV